MTELPVDEGTPEMSPEGKALYARVMTALQEGPAAMNCPISFNWTGTEQQSHLAAFKVRLFAQLMHESFPRMDFGMLKSVVFHYDYERGICEVARDPKNAPIPTKEAGGLSVAMLVRGVDGVHLVMQQGVAFALISDDDQDWAQHVIRHELCHVDDYAYKKALTAKVPDKKAFAGYESYMAPLAEALWDEFYANKYSAGPWTGPRVFIDLLRDILPSVRKDSILAILSYRTSADLSAVRSMIEPKARFIAQCFGYAMGALSGCGKILEDEAPEEAAMLERLGLKGAWNDLLGAVEGLDAKRPGWDSAHDLRALFPGCRSIFAGLGLRYRPHGEGAYIEIPYTDETDPIKVVAYTGSAIT